MEFNGDDAAGGEPRPQPQPQPQNPKSNRNPNAAPQTERRVSSSSKVKSCKGCLYYSSIRKSKSKNPTCVGISGTLQQFSSYTVGEAELEALNRGTNLANFRYACLGYSIYLENQKSSADSQKKMPKLPFCIGLEMLMDKKPSESPVGHVPVPAYKSEEHENTTPQPQGYKPPHVRGEEFFNRFKRNASLVASGVAKNLNRVGNYVKETVDDILNPYRRGPK